MDHTPDNNPKKPYYEPREDQPAEQAPDQPADPIAPPDPLDPPDPASPVQPVQSITPPPPPVQPVTPPTRPAQSTETEQPPAQSPMGSQHQQYQQPPHQQQYQQPTVDQPRAEPLTTVVSHTPAGALRINGEVWAPAGFSWRLGAFLLDAILLIIAHKLLLLIIGYESPDPYLLIDALTLALEEMAMSTEVSTNSINQITALQQPLVFAGWFNVAICAAYYTVFHGMLGATMGKLILGLKVLRSDGRPLDYLGAFGRYILYFITAKLIYTAWLIPWNAERKTGYDMLLKTNVFRKIR